MKLISVMTPCYNEEENVREVYLQVKEVFDKLGQYRYEHVFIDNASSDNTVGILKEIAAADKNVKVIVNSRNFGHVRSPFYCMFQTQGDAVISVVADLQDPPTLIPEFLKKWEEGYKTVVGVKQGSDESRLMYAVRRAYYRLIGKLSEVQQTENFTGFALVDRVVVEALRRLRDPYPYFRGLIMEVGYEVARVPYHQPARKRGLTKNNFFTLYDVAMLGITTHSKAPLRLATMSGFCLSILSLLVAFGYFVAKLLFWDYIPFGFAPLLIGTFFAFAVQLFFIGLLGEYIGTLQTYVMRRPLVFEKERINFDEPPRRRRRKPRRAAKAPELPLPRPADGAPEANGAETLSRANAP
jgi:glycosyltransferase involved in cell wall biosynthesis